MNTHNTVIDGDTTDHAPTPDGTDCARVLALIQVGPLSLSPHARHEVADHIDECAGCAKVFDDLFVDSVAPPDTENRTSSEASDRWDFWDTLDQRIHQEFLRLQRVHARGTLREVSQPAVRVSRLTAIDPLDGHFAPGRTLRGNRLRFRIRRLIGVGPHTETYLADAYSLEEDNGEACGRAVVKIPRLAEDISPKVVKERLETISAVVHANATLIDDLANLPNVAPLIDFGNYSHSISGQSSNSAFVAYDYIDGGVPLMSYLTAKYAQGGHFRGVPHAHAFATLARNLSAALLELHSRCVVHGDISPRNILVSPDGRLILVDAGESVFREVLHSSTDFSGYFYRAKDWTSTPANDIYSVGATLYAVATAKEPIGFRDYDDIEVLKQQILLKLRQANPPLFYQDAAIADLIAMCIRPHDNVEHASELQAEIDTFWPEPSAANVLDALRPLEEPSARLNEVGHPLFRVIAGSHLRACRRRLVDLSHGVYDVSGNTKMRRAAVTLLGGLGPGDEFMTVSVLPFWYPENMGTNGRFLSMCRNAAFRGAVVRRVFLLDESPSDPHLNAIVSAQLNAVESLEPEVRPRFCVRYLTVNPEQRRRFVLRGRHFGLFVKDGHEIVMSPVYDAKDCLTELRFRSGLRHQDGGLRHIFDSFWSDAKPLADLTLTHPGNFDWVTAAEDVPTRA
jgi:serine/threonine protein kinase